MSKVDFHILDSSDRTAVLTYICRLLRKAYKLGHKAYVRVDNDQDMQQLDTLLWTFSELDFIPHAVIDKENGQEAVIIGMIERSGDGSKILVNLGDRLPEDYASYSRVIEVIGDDPSAKAAGRERYRQYQQKNDELTNHQISVN